MKKNKIIIALAVIAIATACSTVALTGRKQLTLVSDSEILSLSSQSYKEFVGTSKTSTNSTNTAMVKRVGQKIATVVESYLKANGRESEVANFSWEFNLVRGTDVNAWCMPGGKVVVFEGILPITQNETGLAVVLGHEIAHAVAKHSNEQISQQMLLEYGASVTDLLASGSSSIVRGSINTLYGVGTQVGVSLPFSRTHEYEADHMGLIFMAMAGYDPNEAVGFWQRMQAANSGGTVELLSTHPSDANRIAKIKEYLPEALKYYKK